MDDGTTFGMPGTLFDFLRRQAAQKKQRGQGRATKRAAKRGPAVQSADNGPRFVRLVEGDQLFFRVLLQAGGPSTVSRVSQAAGVEETFRRTFSKVWHQIPEADRQALCAYWRDKTAPASPGAWRLPLHPRPSIRVVDSLPGSPSPPVCDDFGTKLNFALSLVAEQPDRLPAAIGRALVEAYLFASRRHWALALELVEEPLERWERRRGKNIDDDARDAKIDRLEAAHRIAYEEEIAEVLARWGFGQGVTPERR
jgi:hypothetical protein